MVSLIINCFINISIFLYKILFGVFLFFLIVHNTFAATGVKHEHAKGELQIPTCIDGAVKGIR